MSLDRLVAVVSVTACLLILAQDAASRTKDEIRAARHDREVRLEACYAQCARGCK